MHARVRERIGRSRLCGLLASTSVAALLIGGGTPQALATPPCTTQNGGTVLAVTNAGAISCIYIFNNATVSGNVTNTGTGVITATGSTAPSRTGITVNNASIGGAIVNAGHIAALASGIIVSSSATVSGGITNSGTISGAFGITVASASTFGGGIGNAGTISVGHQGIQLDYVANATGGISNSGTILAGQTGIVVAAAGTLSGGISNSGLISAGGGIAVTRVDNFGASVGAGIGNSGTIIVGGPVIFVGHVSSFFGGISNTGTLSTTSNAVFIASVSTFTGGISNSGTILGAALGVHVDTVSVFAGGISNAGLISTGYSHAVQVTGIGSFSGGISNSGTIIGGKTGILVESVSAFSGGVGNSGNILAAASAAAGIYIDNVSTFSGGVANSGTINGGLRAVAIQNVSLFAGGVSNRGTLSASGSTALFIGGVSTFEGGVTNSGTISGLRGIYVANGSTFDGGVSNSGAILGQNAIVISNIAQFGTASAGGGINNSGTISATVTGIRIANIASLAGGISNSGTIWGGASGIVLGGFASSTNISVSTFSGGITNSGTILAGAKGIFVGGTANVLAAITIAGFSGGISNAGSILGGYGIVLGGLAATGSSLTISNFSGGISNSGRISASSGNGIWVGGTAVAGATVAISSFSGGITNSGTISASAGGLVGAGILVGGAAFIDASLTISTFSGGIANSGTISASGSGAFAGNGIWVGGIAVAGGALAISTFSGGISNSGMISARNVGVFAGGIATGGGSFTLETFAGGITNSGTISARHTGIVIEGISTFLGNVSNSGAILARNTGIFICSCATLAGGAIVNSGTISAGVGIFVDNFSSISIFDSGTIVGAAGTAIDLTQASGGNTLTLGPGYNITGNVLGYGSDTFQLGGTGSGSFDLSTIGAQYIGFTTFNVVSGVWTVSNTFGQSQAWNVNGGTLAGTGTLNSVNVNSGGTLEPGTIGVPGTFMTINGNLAFQSGAIYLVNINGTTASRANVSGAVTLNGAAEGFLASGSYSTKTTYDILDPTSISGRFTGFSVINAPGFSGNLTYTTTGVFVNLTANIGGGGGLNTNRQNVANGINNYFNSGGTLPESFFPVFTAVGNNLGNTLSQLSGEAATGAEVSAFQLTNAFLNLMLDPFVNGRGYGPGTAGGSGNSAIGFAPDEQASLPSDIALAYASILGKAPPQNFDQRWSAWGAAFGGSSNTSGDPTVGSHDITAGTYGFASGMDYHVSPTTVVGFALAGAGTNWGLSSGLGGGYSDALQLGTYGITRFGPAYLSGALSFSNHWFTTNRSALGDQLTANFAGQSYGARFEGGYRVPVWRTFGVTPYGALQAQDFQTASYSESDTTGGGFGLSYNAMNATDVRTELGARFDDPTLLYGKPLILFGRLAWAHDFVSNPALSAAFESLPGSTFTVNGAPIPQNSALTTAGAQYFLASNWSVIAKFDGEFANGAQTYGGSGTLRYSW